MAFDVVVFLVSIKKPGIIIFGDSNELFVVILIFVKNFFADINTNSSSSPSTTSYAYATASFAYNASICTYTTSICTYIAASSVYTCTTASFVYTPASYAYTATSFTYTMDNLITRTARRTVYTATRENSFCFVWFTSACLDNISSCRKLQITKILYLKWWLLSFKYLVHFAQVAAKLFEIRISLLHEQQDGHNNQ